MTLAEMDHPIAPQIVDVCQAVEEGIVEKGALPEHIRLRYTSPLDDDHGCTVIQLADWQTENVTSIAVPVFSSEGHGPTVYYGEKPTLTGARIVIKDMLRRHFQLNTTDGTLGIPYIQFDIVPEGIVYSTEHNGLAIVQMGTYDEAPYGIYTDVLKAQGSLAVLHEIATDFLGK